MTNATPATDTELVAAMFPAPEDAPLRQAAAEAAERYRRGELSLEQIGARLAEARRAEAAARAAARIAGVLAVRSGGSKAGTAAALGVDRMALLKWLGER
ncbi:hypothetical protein [Nocardia sp. NPDC050435]|uniref:hypothetical protein n=1 Tax=Nocardia sp. NPDC050435 TaxID=3155040 RepID=UPI0033FBDE53